MPLLQVHLAGEVPYRTAWAWQQARLARMIRHPEVPDGLLLLTHPPVYTLGAGADPKFLKSLAGRIGSPDTQPESPAPEGPEVLRVERGGEVTYHGPGQWVGYALLNLKRHRTVYGSHGQPDLHRYLRHLEEVLIQTVAHFGLRGSGSLA